MDESLEQAFDRYTRVVVRALDAPVAMLSLVAAGTWVVVSRVGPFDDLATCGCLPPVSSFCWDVIGTGAPVSVHDAASGGHDERLGVAVGAYAGVPLREPDGTLAGTLCAIDAAPHPWSDGDMALLKDLAAAAGLHLASRRAAMASRRDASMLSHQLRNGLTALSLEVAELEARAEDDGHREAAQRLSQLLSRQGDLADGAERRAEAGLRQHAGTHDVHRLLTAVLRRSAEAARAVDRRVVLAAVPPLTLRTDARALCHVLDGMVGTLLRHGRGPVTLAVSVEPGLARFCVSDEGEGLLPDVTLALTGRHDHAHDVGRLDVSLAEAASQSLGGRLVLPVGTRNTLELVVPR